MKFSQRIGKSPLKNVIQLEFIDEELKTAIWNVFYNSFYKFLYKKHYSALDNLFKNLNETFFDKRADHFYGAEQLMKTEISTWFFKAEWYEIYDFIEKICYYEKNWNKGYRIEYYMKFVKNLNDVLKSNVSGYRIINYLVIPISNEIELKSIEEATRNNDKFSNVSIHFKSALAFLSNREKPDYRNSIKESISAVESACRMITGENTLGKALKKLESSGIQIHQQLKNAFEKLYLFTNDKQTGIRHALIEDTYSPTFDEAKFMLISCTSFVNYLKSKSN